MRTHQSLHLLCKQCYRTKRMKTLVLWHSWRENVVATQNGLQKKNFSRNTLFTKNALSRKETLKLESVDTRLSMWATTSSHVRGATPAPLKYTFNFLLWSVTHCITVCYRQGSRLGISFFKECLYHRMQVTENGRQVLKRSFIRNVTASPNVNRDIKLNSPKVK